MERVPERAVKLNRPPLTWPNSALKLRDNYVTPVPFPGRSRYQCESGKTAMGRYNFSSAETALPYLQTTTVGAGQIGFPYASFLPGLVDSGSVNNWIITQYRRPPGEDLQNQGASKFPGTRRIFQCRQSDRAQRPFIRQHHHSANRANQRLREIEPGIGRRTAHRPARGADHILMLLH